MIPLKRLGILSSIQWVGVAGKGCGSDGWVWSVTHCCEHDRTIEYSMYKLYLNRVFE